MQTVKRGMKTILAGAQLPMKFWPYAFHHYLRLYNMTPHGDREASPIEICTGTKPSGKYLRMFGCRVHAITPDTSKNIMERETREGIFLGFANTMKNVYYYDLATHQVKTAQHVVFDESMIGLPEKTPNAQVLEDL